MKNTPAKAGKRAVAAARPPKPELLRDQVMPFVLGLWIAVSLLKFGNPIILSNLVIAPSSGQEFLFWSWPFTWGCVIAGIALIVAFATAGRWDLPRKRLLLWLPALWFGWQILAGARTVSASLTNPTLVHFGITVAAFYAGYFALSQTRGLKLFFLPVLVAFAWALLQGFDQHYGGLEATRELIYEQENWQSLPPEYLKKIATNRIFGPLVYPNAFATVILLLGPVLIYQLWRLGERWPRVLQGVLCGVLGYMAVACLVWTGSKGGWLVALAAAGVMLLQLPAPKKIKIGAVAAVAVIGLAAFFIKYGAYFQRGAPSVGARFTYWSAAFETAKANPVFGTGPGTFAVPYGKIKPTDAEMARLTHNDYLEQASDSGWIGFILYGTMILWIFIKLYRYSSLKTWVFKLILVGLLAWALQSLIEFGLYIPAISWTAFLMMGWAVGETVGKEASEKQPKAALR